MESIQQPCAGELKLSEVQSSAQTFVFPIHTHRHTHAKLPGSYQKVAFDGYIIALAQSEYAVLFPKATVVYSKLKVSIAPPPTSAPGRGNERLERKSVVR